MRAFIASILILGASSAAAHWDPKLCWSSEDLSSLSEQKFLKLKADVSKALKNSWCSKDKIELLMDLVMIEKPQVCVEIGAFTGSSVLPVAATLSFLRQGKVYAIECWSNDVAVRNMTANDPNKPWWSSVDMKKAKDSFKILMSSWGVSRYVLPIALPSDQAVSKINEEIDFLHLDGDYSESGSLKDVELYVPKVKQGGYILFSNLYTTINGKQPKIKAFCALLETCEIVREIESDNAILFKKL